MIVVCVFSYVTVCIVFDHVGKWWVYRCIMCSVIMSGYVLCDDLVFC